MKAMATKTLRSLFSCTSGAVAPTVALSLVGLIAAGGLAFDYSRLVGMHSELQNAADQAALAAASQLDGKEDATKRAAEAAANLVTNSTLISDDVKAAQIGVPATNIAFFEDKEKTKPITRDDASTTDDALAHYVEVTVDGREVFYALTPIVAAMSSGDIDAAAMAGMGSAICKVPPVMFCNPNEVLGVSATYGADFDAVALRGAGLKLLAGAPDLPGNFGFLDNESGQATKDLAKALGHDSVPGDCSSVTDEVGLTPGQREVVFNAFNTRFDINTNGANTCPDGGPCSAARNVRKDLVRKNQCGTSGNSGWQEPDTPYRPVDTTPLASNYPSIMGHPRDICHAVSFNGSCSGGIIGDKIWDRNAYFWVNYGWNNATWKSQTTLADGATRFEVYQWELSHMNQLPPQPVNGGASSYSAPVCLPAAPVGLPDRRRMSVAVVNCLDQAGKIAGNDEVKVLKWVDVFLVEPAFNRGSGAGKRTTDDQVYVEVIGPTDVAGGANVGQVVRRDVPYLVE
jgi:Flp pilus assembly protein TadG